MRTVEEGIGAKLGLCLQLASCFVICYVFCFARGWKLTLVILSAMPFVAGMIRALRWVGLEPVIAGLNTGTGKYRFRYSWLIGALGWVGTESVITGW